MKKAGFSLVELLVVVSILTIISAFAAPAWRDALAASRRTVCSSNLRQMYAAYMGYLGDHDGKLFPFMEQVDGKRLWYWGLETGNGGAEGQRDIDRTQARLAPYLGEGAIETCPEFPYRQSMTKEKFSVNTYGYGLNVYLLLDTPANRTAAIQSFSAIARPSEIIIWGDSAQVNTHQPPASPQNPMIEEWYYLYDREATCHFRHVGKMQAVMGDGAVRLFSPFRLLPQCDGQIGFLEPPGQKQYLLSVY